MKRGTGVRMAIAAAALMLGAGAAVLDEPALVSKGIAEYDEGSFQAAIADLEKATHQNPLDAKAFYYLANAYWRLDQDDKARGAFDQVAKLDPAGSFGSEARDWLSANGNAEAMASAIHLRSQPDSGEDQVSDAPTGETYAASDGRMHLAVPEGFSKDSDEADKGDGGDRTRVVFKRDMRGGGATFLVEARYHSEPPSARDKRVAIGQLTDDADKILADVGVREYDVSGMRSIDDGQIQDIKTVGKERPMRGMLRGAWSGDTFVVVLALAPKADWKVVRRVIEPAIESIAFEPAAPGAAGSHGGTASGSAQAASPGGTPGAASPSPSPTLMPDAPWWLRVQSQVATDSPGLYAPPWATPTSGGQ